MFVQSHVYLFRSPPSTLLLKLCTLWLNLFGVLCLPMHAWLHQTLLPTTKVNLHIHPPYVPHTCFSSDLISLSFASPCIHHIHPLFSLPQGFSRGASTASPGFRGVDQGLCRDLGNGGKESRGMNVECRQLRAWQNKQSKRT